MKPAAPLVAPTPATRFHFERRADLRLLGIRPSDTRGWVWDELLAASASEVSEVSVEVHIDGRALEITFSRVTWELGWCWCDVRVDAQE